MKRPVGLSAISSPSPASQSTQSLPWRIRKHETGMTPFLTIVLSRVRKDLLIIEVDSPTVEACKGEPQEPAILTERAGRAPAKRLPPR